MTSSTAQREHAAAMQRRMLKGRRIARLIFNFFKRNPKMGVINSVTDLAKLEWMGDKQIHKFLMMWRLMLDQMQTTLPAEVLIEILMRKMGKSVVLKEDIAHFYRLDEDDSDRNCDFLIRSMENYLDRGRYRTNRANDLQSMLSQAHVRTGAPAVLDTSWGNVPSEASERRKKKRQERKAKVAATKAAAAPKGKGKGKGPGKYNNNSYDFNQPSGCPKTAEECWFLHKKLPATEVAKMVQPPSRAASGANSPAGGKPGPKAKAGPTFAKSGGCQDTNCAFMHLDEAVIEEFKGAGKVLKDNAAAKP